MSQILYFIKSIITTYYLYMFLCSYSYKNFIRKCKNKLKLAFEMRKWVIAYNA